jgi:uncharacterized OsmC-like protein
MIKKASAVWKGGFKDGGGTISTESGALKEAPYGVKARFESGPGTNPEELIGAAHSGCFAMAFSLMLGEAGFKTRFDTIRGFFQRAALGGNRATTVFESALPNCRYLLDHDCSR